MHRTDVGFLRTLTTKTWVGTSPTGRNVWTSKVLLCGVVTSRKILSFLALFFVPSPCETQQKSVGECCCVFEVCFLVYDGRKYNDCV